MPLSLLLFFFFFNDPATTEIYTLSLHDALPISPRPRNAPSAPDAPSTQRQPWHPPSGPGAPSTRHRRPQPQSGQEKRNARRPRRHRLPRQRPHPPRGPSLRGFFLLMRRPPRSTLFPNTMLFRSQRRHGAAQPIGLARREAAGDD